METTVASVTPLLIAELPDVRSREPRDITFDRFIGRVRGNEFKTHVTRYRSLACSEETRAEAKRLKESTPCVVMAGTCRGGHAVKNLTSYSGLVCIDLDHTDLRTDDIVARVSRLPWVVAAFRSISGNGVKVVARVGTDDARRRYPALYAAVGRAVSQCAEHPYDEKCRILTQPCYYSWDPAAYYAPQATPFTLPPEASEEAPKPSPVTPPPSAGNADAAQASAPGFLEQFVADFEHAHPFARGGRNDVTLKLGRTAACKGFSRAELERLIQLYSYRHATDDFRTGEIRERVLAGYQYFISRKEAEKGENKGHFQGSSPLTLPESEGEEEKAADVLEKNEALMADVPLIPQAVYDALPPLLARCVQPAANLRERDFLLMGALNSCSALLSGVRFVYKRVEYSPHFYLAVVAPAGTGKGVIAYTASLLDATEDWYARRREEQMREQEEAQLLWEQEVVAARKEKRTADLSRKPEPLHPQYFKLPATISKSRLIESLAASGDTGCAMATTEMATLTSAIGTDYGRFEDILLKAAHHEEVASSYKVDGIMPLVARRPRLAVAMSGTPEQFAAFFRSMESGLYSRFAVCTRPVAVEWEACAPDDTQPDLARYYRTLSEELLGLHIALQKHATHVTFTPAQWAEHTEFFSRMLVSTHAEGRDAVLGIIFRHGLLVMRLAAVLAVLRKQADFPTATDYRCPDADFHAALLIARTLLEHSLLLSSTLPDSVRPPVKLRKAHLLEAVLRKLPRKFAYTDFIEEAVSQGISRSTAQRMLRRLLNLQLIVKQGDVYRVKRRGPFREGSKGMTLRSDPKRPSRKTPKTDKNVEQ